VSALAATPIIDLVDQLRGLGHHRVLLVVLPPGADAVTVFLRELDPLDAVDKWILKELRQANRDTGLPASSVQIAAKLAWAERTVRERLSRLEERGEVCRPDGERSGYTILNDEDGEGEPDQ